MEDSKFVKEIQNRLDSLFAGSGKPLAEAEKKAPEEAVAAAPAAPEAVPEAQEVPPSVAPPAGPPEPPAAVRKWTESDLQELKSTVLSLEWEISDELLEKLDEGMSRLAAECTNDLRAQAFIRIMMFLGRYIREKRAEADARSINLLLTNYEKLESVLLSPDMSDWKRHSLMNESIESYREWVDSVDLAQKEAISPAAGDAGPMPESRDAAVEPPPAAQAGPVIERETPAPEARLQEEMVEAPVGETAEEKIPLEEEPSAEEALARARDEIRELRAELQSLREQMKALSAKD